MPYFLYLGTYLSIYVYLETHKNICVFVWLFQNFCYGDFLEKSVFPQHKSTIFFVTNQEKSVKKC